MIIAFGIVIVFGLIKTVQFLKFTLSLEKPPMVEVKYIHRKEKKVVTIQDNIIYTEDPDRIPPGLGLTTIKILLKPTHKQIAIKDSINKMSKKMFDDQLVKIEDAEDWSSPYPMRRMRITAKIVKP